MAGTHYEVRSPTFASNLVRLLIGLVVLLCGGIAVLALVVDSLHDDVATLEANQEAGRQRTFMSQALSCSIKLAIGGDVDDDAACQAPEVLALYDEHASQVADVIEAVSGG